MPRFSWISRIVSHNLCSDEHESERAFAAGSVLEKALPEQSQTQSVQSHVCSFIRFRNGELFFASVYLVLWIFSSHRQYKHRVVREKPRLTMLYKFKRIFWLQKAHDSRFLMHLQSQTDSHSCLACANAQLDTVLTFMTAVCT